jgi:hypothetical protein
MRHLHLDAERVGERREPAPPLQRREPPRHGHRAQHGRLGPVERRARERRAQHAQVEARGVGDEHPPAQHPAELRQHGLGRRRGVDHPLRDAREALDARRERRGDADERGPAVVQLPAPHEHRPYLRELAALARQAVGLSVHRHELRRGQRAGEQLGGAGRRKARDGGHRLGVDTPGTGRHAGPVAPGTGRLRAVKLGVGGRTCCAVALVGGLGVCACASEDDHANRERPAASINVTAAILDGRVKVSPRRFGAGPIRLIVSNQTDAAQALTFETAGNDAGVTQTTAPINPSGTATLEVDVTRGRYAISTADRGIEPAAVRVGAPRASAQDRLLQP